MPVTANSVRLRNRLDSLRRALPWAASVGLYAAARITVERLQDSIRASWTSNTQIGFDIDNFIRIITELEALPQGGIGLLNERKMGTAGDFEAILGIPGLWHQGTGNGERFGAFINQMGWLFDQVSELGQARSNIWGDTEPQWYLLEYGTMGSGAYAPQAPSLTITTTTINSIPLVWSTFESAAGRVLRERASFS